ncbi:MAG: L,D-transpeptidase [Acidobacteriota bacterium]
MAGQTEAVRLHGLALRQGPDDTSSMLRVLPAGETGTGRQGVSPAPGKGSAAKASATPRGADRPASGKPAAPPSQPLVYVPVADGGGLDRFLAGLASSDRPASGTETDAAAINALKNHFTIEVHLSQRKLYLYENLPDGTRHLVRQYVVAVPGRDMEAPQGWGVVTGISFEPSWRPTPAMKERALKKGKPLPEYVGPGVKDNPMGTFKIILSHGYGFRIHGNNNPGSIGRPVTSGCIRMRNDEGKDMAKMIDVGTEVVILD